MERECPVCGRIIDDDEETHCPECGTSLEEDEYSEDMGYDPDENH